MSLTAEALASIRNLFLRLDRDSNGVLTTADFDTFSEMELLKNHQKWLYLRRAFDADMDGAITNDEFRDGFKREALSRSANLMELPPPETTLETWLKEVEAGISARVIEICQEILQVVSQ